MANAHANEHATWAFCLVGAKAAPPVDAAAPLPPGMRGLRAARVQDGLWLVVADAPLSRYGGDRIEQRLQDLEWVSAVALAHDACIERFLDAGTVVPLKLFTLFSSDARAVEAMAERGDALSSLVERLAGALEWGLRVRIDPDRAREHAAKEGAADAAGKSSGAAFLLKKRAVRDASRSAALSSRERARALYDSLAGHAREAVVRKTGETEADRRIALDAAFLVDRDQGERFAARARADAADLERIGCVVEVTGPWPPYSFVAEA